MNIGIVNIGLRSPYVDDCDIKMEICIRLSDTDLYCFRTGNGNVRADYRIGSVVYGINVEISSKTRYYFLTEPGEDAEILFSEDDLAGIVNGTPLKKKIVWFRDGYGQCRGEGVLLTIEYEPDHYEGKMVL